MKVLVIGSGGREHAMVWKIAQSPLVDSMWCAPGNAGTALESVQKTGERVQNVAIGAEDLEGLLAFAQQNQPDLTVVGPDNPLALGIVDRFQSAGFRIWGPNQKAAQFESSKIFSQEFMSRHGIPTAKAASFADSEGAKAFARELNGACVVKADGLALGKGVLICHSVEEADAAIASILEDKAFGSAGDRILIQELLIGKEVSLHAFCDGSSYQIFPTSQDHKRALDGDKGLNTGGMGAYSPTPFVSESELQSAITQVMDPWLAGCKAEGIDYRGILYPGLMLTADGPKVLEFNSRFGDPETQVYLRKLSTDLVEIFQASIDGTLSDLNIEWSTDASVCIVIASGGYPEAYEKGKSISGIDSADSFGSVKVFHAGTKTEGDAIVTSGGRVLGVTATGDQLEQTLSVAYEATKKIHFDGAYFRSDIGAQAI